MVFWKSICNFNLPAIESDPDSTPVPRPWCGATLLSRLANPSLPETLAAGCNPCWSVCVEQMQCMRTTGNWTDATLVITSVNRSFAADHHGDSSYQSPSCCSWCFLHQGFVVAMIPRSPPEVRGRWSWPGFLTCTPRLSLCLTLLWVMWKTQGCVGFAWTQLNIKLVWGLLCEVVQAPLTRCLWVTPAACVHACSAQAQAHAQAPPPQYVGRYSSQSTIYLVPCPAPVRPAPTVTIPSPSSTYAACTRRGHLRSATRFSRTKSILRYRTIRYDTEVIYRYRWSRD